MTTIGPVPHHPAQLGDTWIHMWKQDGNGKWAVDVKVFKYNTLRGDSYWNSLSFRTYDKKRDAERYAARF